MKDIAEESLFKKIHTIRNQKVMLDKDLAQFYEIPVKVLNQAVKRNKSRFPIDFMFQLTREEEINIWWSSKTWIEKPQRLRSQIVTLETPVSQRGKHIKHLSTAFTEHWITMLASILNSEKAIAVNVQIIRIFIKMRHFLQDTENMHHKITTLELEIKKELQNISHTSDLHNQHIQNLYDLLNELYTTDTQRENREKIGFRTS